MKNKTILFIISITFILACTPQTTKTKKDIDVRLGFDGLKMEFLKNTPPQRIFEGDKFPVVLKIRNSGAADIKNNEAVISLGVEKDYTKSVELSQTGNVKSLGINKGINNIAVFSIEGKSIINQKGGEEVISYNLVAGKVDPQSEFHSSAAIATLCYPYQTILDTTFCMDTDPSNLRPGKKVCKLQDLSFSNGQGAPVAISKIEVQMLPSQESQQSPEGYGKIVPQFLIFVENKGQGIVIKKDAVKEACTQKINHEKFNTIFVRAFLSGKEPGTEKSGLELNCEPKEKGSTAKQGYVKLKDNKDIIRCTFKEGIDSRQDPYLSPLRIEMIYGYTQSISANYLIQKTAR